MGFRVRLKVRINDLLAYITYFIATVIIGFVETVERAANLAAAGTLVVGIECRLPACYTRRLNKNRIHFVQGIWFLLIIGLGESGNAI